MSAKKAVTKNTKPKANIAKSILSSSRKKVDKKVIAIVILIFALALGYLLVRLSQAAVDGSQWLAGTPAFGINGGSIKDKEGGRKAWVASKGNNAAVIDQEYLATRGNQSYCFSPRQETDANVLMRFTITSSTGRVSATETWSNGRGNQMLVCTGIERELDAAVTRIARIDIVDGAGAVAIFSIGRSLVPGTYVDLPTPAPAVSNAPNPSSDNVPANRVAEECPNYTIGKGNANECVGFAQNLLNVALRLSGTSRLAIDKIYGDRTVAAVKQFQGTANKNADGIIGPATWNALLAKYREVLLSMQTPTPAPTINTGSKPASTPSPSRVWPPLKDRFASLYNNPGLTKSESDTKGNFKTPVSIGVPYSLSGSDKRANMQLCVVVKEASGNHDFNIRLQTQGLSTRNDWTISVRATKPAGSSSAAGCGEWRSSIGSTTRWGSTDALKVTVMNVNPSSLRSAQGGWVDSLAWEAKTP